MTKIWNPKLNKFQYINPAEFQNIRNRIATKLMKQTEKGKKDFEIPKKPLPNIPSAEISKPIDLETAEKGWGWSKHSYSARTGTPGHYQYKYSGPGVSEKPDTKQSVHESQYEGGKQRTGMFGHKQTTVPRTGAELKEKAMGKAAGGQFQQTAQKQRKTTQPTAQTPSEGTQQRIQQAIAQQPEKHTNWLEPPKKQLPEIHTADDWDDKDGAKGAVGSETADEFTVSNFSSNKVANMLDQAKEAGNIYKDSLEHDSLQEMVPLDSKKKKEFGCNKGCSK